LPDRRRGGRPSSKAHEIHHRCGHSRVPWSASLRRYRRS
jgi:hypothetical protein